MRKIKTFKTWLKRWVKPEPTFFTLSGPRLSEEEIHNALTGVSDQHPLWRAILQTLQDHIDDASDMVIRPELADKPGSLLAHTAGGLETLKTFQQDLLTKKNQTPKE